MKRMQEMNREHEDDTRSKSSSRTPKRAEQREGSIPELDEPSEVIPYEQVYVSRLRNEPLMLDSGVPCISSHNQRPRLIAKGKIN